jgi:hypothetical protein
MLYNTSHISSKNEPFSILSTVSSSKMNELHESAAKNSISKCAGVKNLKILQKIKN